MTVARVVALNVFTALLAFGCATPAPRETWQPIASWTRPLCATGIVPVEGPGESRFYRVYERLLVIAKPDLPADIVVSAVLVSGRGSSEWESTTTAHGSGAGPRWAWTCIDRGGRQRYATIMLSTAALADMERDRDPDAAIARLLAHEFAHVAGMRSEDDAERLGVYYAERAGFDCRRWVTGIAPHWIPREDRRVVLARACVLAKQGVRPLEGNVLR